MFQNNYRLFTSYGNRQCTVNNKNEWSTNKISHAVNESPKVNLEENSNEIIHDDEIAYNLPGTFLTLLKIIFEINTFVIKNVGPSLSSQGFY
ncbi:hypothetical protein ACI65C_000582 [Semiaphis heraclei]